MKRRNRDSLRYKIDMFFYRLTWDDIVDFLVSAWEIISCILIVIIGFLIIFIVPALFH